MTHRIYRLVIGVLLLIFLYFDLNYLMLALIAMLLLEGVTNVRIPRLITRLRNMLGARGKPAAEVIPAPDAACPRFGFDSERVMSLLMGLILLLSYVVFYHQLWFFPWFLGFALLGSGVSGICPMLIAFKWLGFK